MQAALDGQRQVVFVTGEAGIGKTTLVDAFQDQVARYPDLRIARGQCIFSVPGPVWGNASNSSSGKRLGEEE
ncbi:MAG: ATP-binding protein [Acidobacteria bacterium]|nr:ATP-binding protein [Acidobacteriota bacterium]